jgi:hypothetical protein
MRILSFIIVLNPPLPSCRKGPFELLVPKTCKAHQVLEELAPKIPIESNGSRQLRMFEVYNFRLHRVFNPDDYISTIQDTSTIYAEVEKNIVACCQRLTKVYAFVVVYFCELGNPVGRA